LKGTQINLWGIAPVDTGLLTWAINETRRYHDYV